MSLSVNHHGINSTVQPNTQFPPTNQGKLGGKTVVVADPSYLKKQDVQAGVGPGLGEALIKSFMVGAYLFASFVATLAVGIATASLSSAAVTAGVMIGIPLALLLIYDGGTALKQRFSGTH